MEIRLYRDSDFPAVVALWDAAGLSVPYNDPAIDIPRAVGSPNARLFVGEIDGRIVGTILTGHDGHRGWLYRLAVAPEHRRKGFGRRLVAQAEAWLAGEGMPKVELMIRAHNVAVRDFYARLGYAVAARLVMQKGLVPSHANPGTGTLEIVITYLEMTAPPTRPSLPRPAGKLALLRAEKPTVSFYRFLYNTVGERWFWYERRRMTDDALAAIIQDPKVEIYVLYVSGTPAGYIELDRRGGGDVNIALFGLMPEFIGRGYGAYLLDWAVSQAWTYGPSRLTVNTCSLDHPRALRMYQRAGFMPYRQAQKVIEDPRRIGLIPEDVQPRQA